MSKKVLHVISGLGTGGAERALYNILWGGIGNKFDNEVVSLSGGGDLADAISRLDVPVHVLNMSLGGALPRALINLKRLKKEFKPDLIQGWMYHGNLAATLVSMALPFKPKTVWNVRHSLYSLTDEKRLTQYVIRANRLFSNKANAIIYNGHLSREQHEDFGFESSNGLVIPNGFDMDSLGPDPYAAGLVKREFSIPDEALVVGHVARFHPMKDHASFLKAAVQVAEKFPTAYFLLVGRDVSLHHPHLTGIVPENIQHRFRIAGERQDVTRLMQAMDVFCLSSWSEAFPNVIGEAMATGVPCVTTDVGDSAVIVGNTGKVVPPSDDRKLSEGLLSMLRMSGDERHELGRIARERIEREYGLRSAVSRYQEIYDSICRSGFDYGN